MATFSLNYGAFGREVLAAPFMVTEMHRRAEAGAAFARTIAPVDEDGPHPGRFRDSIGAESGVRPEAGRFKSRAVGRVVADDPAAFQIELGTQHTPAHRTLGKSLDAMGGN